MALEMKESTISKSRNARGPARPEPSSVPSTPPGNYPRINKNINIDACEFPSRYDVTQLTLIPRDPHWLHAYWEISPASSKAAKTKLGRGFEKSRYVLRMHDVTEVDFNGKNANHSFDLDVGPHTSHWYIQLWRDNVNYCGEIGLKTPDGRFHSLARSNCVSTPRASFSERRDVIWMERNEEDVSDPFILERPRAERRGAVAAPVKSRRRYLSENDIRAYYSQLFPLLRRVRGSRAKSHKAEQHKEKKSFKDILSYGNPSPTREGFLPEKFLGGQHVQTLFWGASAEFMQKGGASERPGASEHHQGRKRTFFFEIGTELIVYGRTEPDATVHLGQKNIKLREDGTFSLHFSLPDGTIPLDFIAESADKVEKRGIQTSVVRTKTKYNP